MAALTITVTQVLPSSELGRLFRGTAGETLTRGMVVYKKASDGRYWKADADTLAEADARALVMSDNSAGQEVLLHDLDGGDVTIGAGAAMTVGLDYYVGAAAAGTLVPRSDLAAGDYVSLVGIAITAAVMRLRKINTGVVVPA